MIDRNESTLKQEQTETAILATMQTFTNKKNGTGLLDAMACHLAYTFLIVGRTAHALAALRLVVDQENESIQTAMVCLKSTLNILSIRSQQIKDGTTKA